MDQRNETFVPHVLAIVAGTTVDFPNNDRTYHNVFSLSKTQVVRPRALRRGPVEGGPLRPARHRARVLRHPLAHERVHPRLRAPLLRGDRRRGPVPDRQRAARHLHGRSRGTRGRRSETRARSIVPEAGGDVDVDFRARRDDDLLVAHQPDLPGERAAGRAGDRRRDLPRQRRGHAAGRERAAARARRGRRRCVEEYRTTLVEHFSREARLIADLPTAEGGGRHATIRRRCSRSPTSTSAS